MSLKSKIEAVIYASEEPVTLNQLVGLLGQEAQAELDRFAAAQQTLSLDDENADADDANDAEEMNSEVIGDAEEGEVTEAKPTADEEPAEQVAESTETAEAIETTEEQPAAEVSESADASSSDEAPVRVNETENVSPAGEDAEKKTARETKEEKERTRKLREYFRFLLDQLIADYAKGDRGLEVREVAGGFRLATKPEYHDAVRGFVKSLKPPLKLSLQALETLAVVAYKQPITAPEVSEIRGVDSGGVLGSLMTRKLITTAGRKQVIGRPILYKTTKDFLLRFGLRDINELPSIEEFERMAGELAEQEEIPMEANPAAAAHAEAATADPEGDEAPIEHHVPETPDELQAERHTHLPQADGSPDTEDDPLDDELPEDEEDTVDEAEEELQETSELESEATPESEAAELIVEEASVTVEVAVEESEEEPVESSHD